MTTTADAQPFVTDGGLETDLIYHHGFDLPEFAAFPLVESDSGRDALKNYYAGYAATARAAAAGLLLETPTWRANPDWGEVLGYDADGLDRANRASVELLQELARDWSTDLPRVLVSGQMGPRGDGYRPGAHVDPDEAADYHRPQLASFAAAGADQATVLTLTDVGEAIGVARAAADVGLPLGLGFTVETDGRLPRGETLDEVVARVDADTPADVLRRELRAPDPCPARRGRGSVARPGPRAPGERVDDEPRGARQLRRARRRRPGAAGRRHGDPASRASGGPHRRWLLRHRRPARGCDVGLTEITLGR